MILGPSDRTWTGERAIELASIALNLSGPIAAAAAAEYGLPLNTPFHIGLRPWVEARFQDLKRELSRTSLYWEDAVTDLSLGLLREIGNAIVLRPEAPSAQQLRTERTLQDIRRTVHADLASRWTVREMAALGGMKPNFFSNSYRNYYGVSPIHDLLCARLNHAENLLKNMPMNVAHIANLCGFLHVEHFTRLYRKRTGCSPRQKRNRIRQVKISIDPCNIDYETTH